MTTRDLILGFIVIVAVALASLGLWLLADDLFDLIRVGADSL